MRGPAARARRAGRAGPHLPRGRAAPAAVLRAPAAGGARDAASCWTARSGWSPQAAAGCGCAPTGPPPATWPARSSGPSRPWSSPEDYAVGRGQGAARDRRATRRRWPRSSPRTSGSSAARGVIDFEDVLLRRGLGASRSTPTSPSRCARQYRHFVVDEYQDVNPLQQRLLDAWLGGRGRLCVVGDASQTIYSFTGATPAYLLGFPRPLPRRHGGPAGPRLPLDAAGGRRWPTRLDPRRPAASRPRLRLELVGQRPPGPSPSYASSPTSRPRPTPSPPAAAALIDSGTPARRDRRAVPHQRAVRGVRAGAGRGAACRTWCAARERFFERPEVRAGDGARCAAPTRVDPGGDPAGGGRGRGARRRRLGAPTRPRPAAPLASGGSRSPRWSSSPRSTRPRRRWCRSGRPRRSSAPVTLADFNEELARRAAQQHAPTVEGVTLASLHSAKGLEWDAVFLVGLTEGTLPTTYAKTPGAGRGGAPAALRRGHPGAGAALAVLAAARSPGGRARRPSRFLPQLDRSAGAERAGAGAARRTERRRTQVVVLPDLRRHPARRGGPQAGALPDLPVRPRRGAVRAAAPVAAAGGRGAEGAGVRGLHRRDPDRAGRAAARTRARNWSRSPGSARASCGLYGETVLALVAGAAVDDVCPQKSFESDR